MSSHSEMIERVAEKYIKTNLPVKVLNPDIKINKEANTLAGNRKTLSEEDVRLSEQFRNSVILDIKNRVKEITPKADRTPRVFVDGDMSLDIQIPVLPSKYPQMLFRLILPKEIFCQFSFSREKASLTEVYSGEEVIFGTLNKYGTPLKCASFIIRQMKKLVHLDRSKIRTSLTP